MINYITKDQGGSNDEDGNIMHSSKQSQVNADATIRCEENIKYCKCEDLCGTSYWQNESFSYFKELIAN